MKKYAIIVGGGKGVRIGGDIPKQFLLLKGRPVLFHTIEKFVDLVDDIIVVLPADLISFWNKLVENHNFKTKLQLVAGGSTRSDSVLNALKAIENEGLVAIHDAVRPLVSKKLIQNLLNEAAIHGNAVPATAISESMRQLDTHGNKAVDRSKFAAVQTPQCFEIQIIKSAYALAGDQLFSDDAGVIDFSGGQIHLVTGETTNIKITFPEDLLFAESMLDAIKM